MKLLILTATLVVQDYLICAVNDGADGSTPYEFCWENHGGLAREYRETGDERTCMRINGQWPECCFVDADAIGGQRGKWICEAATCHE